MKRIIKGRRYDTDAPQTTEVATNSRGYGGDFSSFAEGLYRTGRGTWFLAGSGGPLSRYGRSTGFGQELAFGERIIPLTEEEARTWLEELNYFDEIEEHFSSGLEEA